MTEENKKAEKVTVDEQNEKDEEVSADNPCDEEVRFAGESEDSCQCKRDVSAPAESEETEEKNISAKNAALGELIAAAESAALAEDETKEKIAEKVVFAGEEKGASAEKPSWLQAEGEREALLQGAYSGGSRSMAVADGNDPEKGRFASVMIMILLLVSLCLGFALALKRPTPSMVTTEEYSGSENPLEGIFATMGPKKDGVAIVNISGAIQTSDSGTFSQQRGADRIVEQLKKLGENKNVKAVVLRINSPGGTVGACQEISSEIKRLKEKGIKVVASLADVAASGGVYIAVQADEILANPGTVTGSVGVVFSVMTLPTLLEKLGVKVETVTSGKYKDIGSYARNMRDDERALLQEIVSRTQEQFLNTVAEGRKKDPEEVRKWADGRIFNGEQAKAYGLIDELGSLQDAVERAWKLAGMEGPPHILKERTDPFEQLSEMFSMSLRSLWPVNLQTELNTHAPLLFYYPGGGRL